MHKIRLIIKFNQINLTVTFLVWTKVSKLKKKSIRTEIDQFEKYKNLN